MIIHTMKNIFLALLLLASMNLAAQNIKVTQITWHLDSLTDLNTTSTSAYSGTFKTDGHQNIQWIQNNGAYITEFVVSSIEGNWENILENGNILFHVSYEELIGTLLFERTTDGSFITLSLQLPSGEKLHHKYHVRTPN
jgi:hypothetical protein